MKKEEKVVENRGEATEEVPEEVAETVVVPGEEKTTPTGAYTKVDLKVVPVVKNVADIPHVTEDEDKVVETTFSKEDAKFFGDLIWNIPEAIFGEYMTVDQKLKTNWSLQFFSYCERKGLDPYSYMFDELGLVLATGVIATNLAAKYRTHKKELEKAEEEKE